MTIKDRYKFLIDYFLEHAPEAETELLYDDPFQLLVAVILSAQCTDVRINLTTPAIFAKYPDAKAMSKATVPQLFKLIKSISYPNNKANHLSGMSKLLMKDYNGDVPMTVEELIKLPGVGRKTANVVTSVIDEQPNMAVDTHVFRVSARIGLTVGAKTPTATEKQLIRHIPAEYVHKAHHWLILHGRYTCVARSPKCDICPLQKICKYYKKHENDFWKKQAPVK
jgi:endonuclease III